MQFRSFAQCGTILGVSNLRHHFKITFLPFSFRITPTSPPNPNTKLHLRELSLCHSTWLSWDRLKMIVSGLEPLLLERLDLTNCVVLACSEFVDELANLTPALRSLRVTGVFQFYSLFDPYKSPPILREHLKRAIPTLEAIKFWSQSFLALILCGMNS